MIGGSAREFGLHFADAAPFHAAFAVEMFAAHIHAAMAA